MALRSFTHDIVSGRCLRSPSKTEDLRHCVEFVELADGMIVCCCRVANATLQPPHCYGPGYSEMCYLAARRTEQQEAMELLKKLLIV